MVATIDYSGVGGGAKFGDIDTIYGSYSNSLHEWLVIIARWCQHVAPHALLVELVKAGLLVTPL